MGDLRIVQLPKLVRPLAPGTVAFSVAPSLCCEHETHRRDPASLLRFTGTVQADGSITKGKTGKTHPYELLWGGYTLFKIEPRAITELMTDTIPAEGDLVAGFSYPCSQVVPFMLTSPGWLTAEGIQACRTDIDPFGSRLCFTSNPAGWMLVEAGWNRPLDPQDLEQWQEVVLYNYEDGATSKRTIGRLEDGYVNFAGGAGGMSFELLGRSRWLFRSVHIPRVAK